MNTADIRRRMLQRAHGITPAHFPRRYETRMESYPLRRRVGLFLVLAGVMVFAAGVWQHQPWPIALGGLTVALSFWLARAQPCTIVLHADAIELVQGTVHERRHRQQLMGWKLAQESDMASPRGSSQCWLLLVANDDDTHPLMIEITRPEFDRDFMDWIFSLPDIQNPLAMASAQAHGSPPLHGQS